MSWLAKLAKWKVRWALLSGAFTLIILPVFRVLWKGSKPRSKTQAKPTEVIDVQAEEIKR